MDRSQEVPINFNNIQVLYSDLTEFEAILWCEKLLHGPDIVVNLREYNPSTEDGLFAKTLRTNDAIGAFLSFYKQEEDKSKRIEEVYALLKLGEGGNGYPGVTHGGLVAAI